MRPPSPFWLCWALIVLLLSACGARPSPALTARPGPLATASPSPVPTLTPARPTPSPSPTALAVIQTPIVWYVYGTPPPDLALVNGALNDALAKRGFNALVELRVIEPSVYTQRMAAIQADGDAWDLASLDGDLYRDWVEQGMLLPLDTAPASLSAGIPPAAWQSLRLGSGVYAIPNPQEWARPAGIAVRADVVEALDLREPLDGLHGFEDAGPLLAKIHAAIQDGILQAVSNEDAGPRYVMAMPDLLRPETAGYLPISMPWVVRYDDPQARPVNWLQTPEFRALAGLRHAWQEAGYCPDRPLTPDQWQAGYHSGEYAVQMGRALPTGGGWIIRPLALAFLTTSAVQSSLTGLNAALSADPLRRQRMLLLVEWTHSDPQIYNLLAYGIEGRHWAWADQERQVITWLGEPRYRPDFAAQLGDQTLSYAASAGQSGLWQSVRRDNAAAAAPALLGFIFDPRPVLAEAAAVQGLYRELLAPLENGQVENIDREIERAVQTLEDAGLAAVQAELTRQAEEWLSAR